MRWFNLTGGGSQTETRQRLTVPGQLDLEYRFSATANDNKAISQKNYISGEELEYQYDSLGRLSRAETTTNSGSAPQWGLSWLYDGFGNRLQQNAVKGPVPTQSILVDPVNNRVQSHSYDANGNTTTTPAQGAMAYDVFNRLKSVAADVYAYAPSGQRLWKNHDYVFSGASGDRLLTAQLAVVGSDLRFVQLSSDSYSHGRRLQVTDRLGSVGSYYPYGEAKSGTVSNADSFATYFRDSTGLDYAQQRYYSSTSGRFVSVDPLQASASPAAPSSWNRFGYVSGDPTNRVDPTGERDLIVLVPGTAGFAGLLGVNFTGNTCGTWGSSGMPSFDAIANTFPGWVIETFCWSGNSTPAVWNQAAVALTMFIDVRTSADDSLGIVAHSHGGQIASLYTYQPNARPVDFLITFGMPMIGIQPRRGSVGTWLNVYSSNDGVQTLGGFRPTSFWFLLSGSLASAPATGGLSFVSLLFSIHGGRAGRTNSCAINIGINNVGPFSVGHGDLTSVPVWSLMLGWLNRAGYGTYGSIPRNATTGYCPPWTGTTSTSSPDTGLLALP